MTQNTIVPAAPSTALGASLRNLADLIDRVPALIGARTYPDSPLPLMIGVRTGLAVHVLAKDFGVEPQERVDHTRQQIYVSFEVSAGLVDLHVFAFDPLPRELHRSTDVTATIEAAQS